MKSVKPPASDLPYTEDPTESLCDIFKSKRDVSKSFVLKTLLFSYLFVVIIQGTMNFYAVVFDFSEIPAVILPPGLYKFVFEFSDKHGGIVNRVNFYFKIF